MFPVVKFQESVRVHIHERKINYQLKRTTDKATHKFGF